MTHILHYENVVYMCSYLNSLFKGFSNLKSTEFFFETLKIKQQQMVENSTKMIQYMTFFFK